MSLTADDLAAIRLLVAEAVEQAASSHNGDGRLLTAAEVADRWQVPTFAVWRLTREGKLAALRLGRHYRYTAEAVRAYEQGGGAQSDD